MAGSSWTDVAGAVGAVLTPVLVAVLAFVLSRTQSRSDELLRVRLDYYRLLLPDLNTLMCYMTFIGTWRDQSPVEILQLKRRLDANFYCAAPLFGPAVLDAYDALMAMTFESFGRWGADARIKTNPYRRRQAWIREPGWDPAWDTRFTMGDDASIPADQLARYRDAYDRLVANIVQDLDITRARARYTTDRVSLNAHAPRARDITGSGA